MAKCLICGQAIEHFISFGKMPIANGFVTPAEFKDEYFFELKTGVCPKCLMVQLTELVDSEKLFHDNYAYFSSISTRMARHFEDFARHVMNDFGFSLGKDGFVVELGSNDGIMLRHFASAGIRHLGVEPSGNVAAAATKQGVNTVCKFFGRDFAGEILSGHGRADAILAANVMCHIPDLHSVFDGVKSLLKPRGILAFEDPYLCDIIEKTSYDQIYDEHVYYFSAHSVSRLAAMHGLELIDVEPQTTHGGSMRYVIAHQGARSVSHNVEGRLAYERALKIESSETYAGLSRKIFRSRDQLVDLLEKAKAGGKRVAGYGATSKSTTVFNFCGIGPDLIEFITDTTPTKIGKTTPGMHIPVVPYEHFKNNRPDYALLLAWNHGEEIMAKERAFVEQGGRFMTFVPEVRIIGEC
ncbi:MAG: SAM-dependent methyltransferase [Bdellovibrionales bacterium RIFOXYD1_FULL_53_11]|nr:MAG: SAM-dependent methyltransferase [Bdellovibrionales bacterium RIFOXYD1_FULL_53_11]